MGSLVGGDEIKIISIGKSDDLFVIKRVSEFVLHILERLDDGIKHHEEHNGTERIALEDSSFE